MSWEDIIYNSSSYKKHFPEEFMKEFKNSVKERDKEIDKYHKKWENYMSVGEKIFGGDLWDIISPAINTIGTNLGKKLIEDNRIKNIIDKNPMLPIIKEAMKMHILDFNGKGYRRKRSYRRRN